ncbi:hypothetical protein DH2020_020669 [Rehmannia glutinosa]|uniref:Uncharacterized protein n=1 Tax=Rehmannia glutinosa TaxID=99300 RepID=A0ABR0WKY2_REHGL
MSAPKQPYPPCAGNSCSYHGYKTAWPELVGQAGPKCKAAIEKDNPFVTVVNVPRNGGTIEPDYCCNRVYLFVDENNVCYFIPTVG